MIFEQMVKRLYDQPSFEGSVRVILGDVIALHGSELGNVQLLAGDCLVIAAQRGFKEPFLEFFAEVRTDDGCACGRALKEGRTVVVRDIETDEEYAPYRAAARAAGYRSVITTPLITHDKLIIGAVSTHFVGVHTPTPIEIDTLRTYSVTAANHLYGLLGNDSLSDKALSMSRRLYSPKLQAL